jgi:hypothetical protein
MHGELGLEQARMATLWLVLLQQARWARRTTSTLLSQAAHLLRLAGLGRRRRPRCKRTSTKLAGRPERRRPGEALAVALTPTTTVSTAHHRERSASPGISQCGPPRLLSLAPSTLCPTPTTHSHERGRQRSKQRGARRLGRAPARRPAGAPGGGAGEGGSAAGGVRAAGEGRRLRGRQGSWPAGAPRARPCPARRQSRGLRPKPARRRMPQDEGTARLCLQLTAPLLCRPPPPQPRRASCRSFSGAWHTLRRACRRSATAPAAWRRSCLAAKRRAPMPLPAARRTRAASMAFPRWGLGMVVCART